MRKILPVIIALFVLTACTADKADCASEPASGSVPADTSDSAKPQISGDAAEQDISEAVAVKSGHGAEICPVSVAVKELLYPLFQLLGQLPHPVASVIAAAVHAQWPSPAVWAWPPPSE